MSYQVGLTNQYYGPLPATAPWQQQGTYRAWNGIAYGPAIYGVQYESLISGSLIQRLPATISQMSQSVPSFNSQNAGAPYVPMGWMQYQLTNSIIQQQQANSTQAQASQYAQASAVLYSNGLPNG